LSAFGSNPRSTEGKAVEGTQKSEPSQIFG